MKAIIIIGESCQESIKFIQDYSQSHKAIVCDRHKLRLCLTGGVILDFNTEFENTLTELQHRIFYETCILKKDLIFKMAGFDVISCQNWVNIFKCAGYQIEYKYF